MQDDLAKNLFYVKENINFLIDKEKKFRLLIHALNFRDLAKIYLQSDINDLCLVAYFYLFILFLIYFRVESESVLIRHSNY